MTANAFIVPRGAIPQVWPGVAEMIDAAYKSADEIMPRDILDELCSGHRQLWVVWSEEKEILAAVLTRIVQLRSCRAMQINACGGVQVERWAHLVALIHAHAKAEGCRKVTIEGRPGWERLFRDYKRTRVILELEL